MSSQSLQPCVLERLHTHDVEPALRFDAWRERAHQWVEMLPPQPGVELEAELTLLRGGGSVFGTMRSTAYEMKAAARRLAHAPDMVVLVLMQAGELRRDAAPGERGRNGPGSLGLYDPWRMGRYAYSEGSREAFLALPRSAVRAALGCDPGNLAIAPAHCVLVPALADQLNHLARMTRQPHRIDAAEYAGLLESTRMLALLALRNLGRHGMDLPDETEDLNRGRHAAAVRFMARELHRHDLDAAAIAQGVGCSRTRLYAAFAAQGVTIMGTLRDMRLQRARAMIEQAACPNLGAISWRCGFADQSGFSKSFKARFGARPSEWHRPARSNPACAK
ncbi:helix-turn-helix transcriptional regulator [Castellaniella hirudinis]|uniref:Helix-turn-helix transcriptional regulator n=1 Tax=Castellaniella hirudinis TaxID=1144617 RepID=A0ABV8S2P6_9BURK